jgi:flagellar basal body-associated protein FliL
MGKCMIEKRNKTSWVIINRAPVLTLWAAVVGKFWRSKNSARRCGKKKQ